MSDPMSDSGGQIPLIYADQISGLRPGVYTSKIEFALESSGGEGLSNTATVVVPTANLVGFAHRVLAQFSEERLLDLIAQRTDDFIKNASNPAAAIEALRKRVEVLDAQQSGSKEPAVKKVAAKKAVKK